MRLRLKYFIITCLIVVLGLLSRKITLVPLWVGDVLWATMIYFILRFFMLKASILKPSNLTEGYPRNDFFRDMEMSMELNRPKMVSRCCKCSLVVDEKITMSLIKAQQ